MFGIKHLPVWSLTLFAGEHRSEGVASAAASSGAHLISALVTSRLLRVFGRLLALDAGESKLIASN